jgi:hypothetical protein
VGVEIKPGSQVKEAKTALNLSYIKNHMRYAKGIKQLLERNRREVPEVRESMDGLGPKPSHLS